MPIYTIHLLLLFWACLGSSLGVGQLLHHYDSSSCSSSRINPLLSYRCDLSQTSCQSYLLYRANPRFRTVSSISSLFGVDSDSLIRLNKLRPGRETLKLGSEVIVQITCSCFSDQHYQDNVTYVVTEEEVNYLDIACELFQGLVTSSVLIKENKFNDVKRDLIILIKCTCPGKNLTMSSGTNVKYLLTYPFKSEDDLAKLAKKFSVPITDILEINNLNYRSTVFTNTTALVPLTAPPTLSLTLVPDSPPPQEEQLHDDGKDDSEERARVWRLYIIIGRISMFFGSLVITAGFIICAVRYAKLKQKPESRNNNIIASPISPEVLTGIKYYSLIEYGINELRSATQGFDEASNIFGGRFYKGSIDGKGILIGQMRFEEIRNAIDAHSRTNHKNILTLTGVCYGGIKAENNYLVYEYPINGCLRECLAAQETPVIPWPRRMKIAFDIAMGIHYLHYCIFPSFARTRISTRNVFVTASWSAKIANIGTNDGGGGEKADIYLFGVVLCEIISGKVMDTISIEEFRKSISFLSGGGCFEQLKGFVDPRLKDDYPLAESLCLAVLAKACVEDESLNRPSIDDIIKVLARII